MFRTLVGLGAAVLLLSGWVLADHYYGHGRTGRVLAEHPLPSDLSPASVSPGESATTRHPAARTGTAPNRPGVPIRLIVPSHGLSAPVSANPLDADGYVHVPRDPRQVSWTSGNGTQTYAAPGSDHGTAMLVSHINYSGVDGAFHDLASYRIGQQITVVLADGRRLRYDVAAQPMAVNKARLAADLQVPGEPLHQEIFGQTGSYGTPRSGRLLLESCGGAFDNRTGNYQDNIFVFALPVN
ncbi:MAG: class F sortase [Jatrophihabitantaceae bacterium]